MLKPKSMTRIFLILSIIVLSLMVGLLVFNQPQPFSDDFDGLSLSSNWNFVYTPTGGSISVGSGLLHYISGHVFQDAPLNAVVLRHWFTPTPDSNKLDIFIRLRVNTFDRFAVVIDRGKVSKYEEQQGMFTLTFRSSGEFGPIITYQGERGELGILTTCNANIWYNCQISIQRDPFLVTYIIRDDGGNLIKQLQVNGKNLTSFSFSDINSIGFNAWTSQINGPYGNVDIDRIIIQTSSGP